MESQGTSGHHMSTVRGDEGLNEDEDDSDSSRSPPTLLNLTPVDYPGISELYTSIIEHQQPEAIESDILDQTEEDVAMEEENIYSLPKNVSQRISITDDLTSAPKKDNNEEER